GGARVRELDMAAHREIGAIELEQESRTMDRVVLALHRVCERGDVGLVGRVMIVAEELRDHTGRGSADKRLRDLYLSKRRPQIVEVALQFGAAAVGDRAIARR